MTPRSETHDRILSKAQELFSRFGAMKTPVADIARALNMSPANVYKFFPSKRALVEAVGTRRCFDLRERLLCATRTRKAPWQRIEDLVRGVAGFFEAEILEEEDLLQIEIMRREDKWQFIREFHDFLRAEFVKLIGEGVSQGHMHSDDPEADAAALMDCLVRVIEPLFLLQDAQPTRDQRMERQLRLLSRAFLISSKGNE